MMPSYSNFNPADYKQNTESHFASDTLRPVGAMIGNSIEQVGNAVQNRQDRRKAAQKVILEKSNLFDTVGHVASVWGDNKPQTQPIPTDQTQPIPTDQTQAPTAAIGQPSEPATMAGTYGTVEEQKDAKAPFFERAQNGLHNLVTGEKIILDALPDDKKAEYNKAISIEYAPVVSILNKVKDDSLTPEQGKMALSAIFATQANSLATSAAKIQDGTGIKKLYDAASYLESGGVPASDLRAAAISAEINQMKPEEKSDTTKLYQTLHDKGYSEQDIQRANAFQLVQAANVTTELGSKSWQKEERGSSAIGSGASAQGTDQTPIVAAANTPAATNVDLANQSSASGTTSKPIGGNETLGEKVSKDIVGNDLASVRQQKILSALKVLNPNATPDDIKAIVGAVDEGMRIAAKQSTDYLGAEKSENAEAIRSSTKLEAERMKAAGAFKRAMVAAQSRHDEAKINALNGAQANYFAAMDKVNVAENALANAGSLSSDQVAMFRGDPDMVKLLITDKSGAVSLDPAKATQFVDNAKTVARSSLAVLGNIADIVGAPGVSDNATGSLLESGYSGPTPGTAPTKAKKSTKETTAPPSSNSGQTITASNGNTYIMTVKPKK